MSQGLRGGGNRKGLVKGYKLSTITSITSEDLALKNTTNKANSQGSQNQDF